MLVGTRNESSRNESLRFGFFKVKFGTITTMKAEIKKADVRKEFDIGRDVTVQRVKETMDPGVRMNGNFYRGLTRSEFMLFVKKCEPKKIRPVMTLNEFLVNCRSQFKAKLEQLS